MLLTQEIIKALAVPSLSRCLTGDMEDLRKLLLLEKTPFASPLLRAFLHRLAVDLKNGGGVWANLLVRIGRFANPVTRRKIIRNLIFHWGVRGAQSRTRIRNAGKWVPYIVAISPTMRCNLHCRGCYSGLYSKEGELNEQELDRLFMECKAMGDYFVVLTGGEPYLLQDKLLRLFRKHNDMYFLTFTNGTLFDEPLVKELARLGNVAPALSLEGFEEETDRRRGPGVYARVLRSMSLLRSKGVLFGASITYARDNLAAVTQDSFIESLLDRGMLFAWYFMFIPVGKDPVLELVPTPEQRLYCGRRVAEMRRKYGTFVADFWNDGPLVGGCLAGARRYMHVLNSGRVEACVFAHFGVDNIRERSLLDAANSPFFNAIREAFPYNKMANLKRPCIITDNPQVLRKIVDEHVLAKGHTHSEDIVRDPAVKQWIDNYAQRMMELTEPEWLRMIEDPDSRWFKGNREYQNLFKLGKKGPGNKWQAAED
jgi:MoaA/NifB/PqqE/SkfB family radical SAM enzyme